MKSFLRLATVAAVVCVAGTTSAFAQNSRSSQDVWVSADELLAHSGHTSSNLTPVTTAHTPDIQRAPATTSVDTPWYSRLFGQYGQPDRPQTLYRNPETGETYRSPNTIMLPRLRRGMNNASQRAGYVSSDQRLPLSVGVHLGSLGGGVHATYHANERTSVTLMYETLDGTIDIANENFNDFEASLKGDAASALVNYHPNGGPFRFSVGAQWGAPTAAAAAVSFVSDPGGTDQTVSALGAAEADWDVGPYVGIGFGTQRKATKGFVLYGDLGVSYMGKVKYTHTNSPNCTSFTSNTAQEDCNDFVDAFADNIDGVNGEYLYPIARLGLSYRF